MKNSDHTNYMKNKRTVNTMIILVTVVLLLAAVHTFAFTTGGKQDNKVFAEVID